MNTEIEQLPNEGMHVDGVIQAGDLDRGARTLRGLTLVFTPTGIEVRSPQPGSDALLAWSGLDSIRCSERTVLPDLQNAAVLELVSEGRSIRFLLPVESVAPGQAAYLELAVPQWLVLYKGAGSPYLHSDLPAPPPASPGAAVAGEATRPTGEENWAGAVPASTPAPNGSTAPNGQSPPFAAPLPPPPHEEWLPVEGPEPAWGLSPVPAPLFEPVPGPWESRSRLEPPPFAPVAPPPTHDPGDPWAGLARLSPTPLAAAPSGNGTSGEALTSDTPPASRRSTRRKRRTRWLWVVLVVLIVLGGALYLLSRHGGANPTANPAALAHSINLRSSDLPSSWIRSSSTASVPPLAPLTKLNGAQQALAACLGQPPTTVAGWFGAGAFPGQLTQVRSPTFGSVTVPTVQMYSTTSVLASSADAQSLAPAVSSPKFGSCFGQYQVTAVAVPATAQVQVVPLPAPDGVKAYGYLTKYSLARAGNEVVGDAFIVGDRTVTLLKASTSGPAIPPAVFNQAYHAVAGRVATANGS